MAVAVVACAGVGMLILTVQWQRGFGAPPSPALLRGSLPYFAGYSAAFLAGVAAGFALARLTPRRVLAGTAQVGLGVTAGAVAAALWVLMWPKSFAAWGWLAPLAGSLVGGVRAFGWLRRHTPYSLLRLALTAGAAWILGALALVTTAAFALSRGDLPLFAQPGHGGQFPPPRRPPPASP